MARIKQVLAKHAGQQRRKGEVSSIIVATPIVKMAEIKHMTGFRHDSHIFSSQYCSRDKSWRGATYQNSNDVVVGISVLVLDVTIYGGAVFDPPPLIDRP